MTKPTFIEVHDEDGENKRIMIPIASIVAIAENSDETATITYTEGSGNGTSMVNAVEHYDDIRGLFLTLP